MARDYLTDVWYIEFDHSTHRLDFIRMLENAGIKEYKVVDKGEPLYGYTMGSDYFRKKVNATRPTLMFDGRGALAIYSNYRDYRKNPIIKHLDRKWKYPKVEDKKKEPKSPRVMGRKVDLNYLEGLAQ